MEIKLKNPKEIKEQRNKVFLLPFFSKEPIRTGLLKIDREAAGFSKDISALEEGEARLLFSQKAKFLFISLGEKKEWNQRRFLLFLRKAVRTLKENKFKEAALFLNYVIPKSGDMHNLSQGMAENILLADYEFNRYKERPKEGWPKIELIEISWPEPRRYRKDIERGMIIGQSANLVRDLANTPGGEMTPEKLAGFALREARGIASLKAEVFDEKKLKTLKMGGILGVSQGSRQKPRLIILRYGGRKSNKKIDLALVGKGVTFDSGGLHIKPAESMREMHLDMSGGAAVLGSMLAIARTGLSLNVVGLVPAVENMPSGQSYRPGDLLRSYSGKTIEVISPDAEGRIILADALSYALKKFKPKMIADIATLTGASVVALGQRAIALFTNQPKIEKALYQIGEDSGDYAWPLPLWDEYEEEIRGTFGDIANVGKTRYGGAITAALFLKNFIDDCPWVHLDIAPTMTSIEGQGLSKGATGTGVRYLTRLAGDFPKIVKSLKS